MTDSSKARKENNCPKCGFPFHFQLRRNLFERLLSSVIPFKKYFCAKCQKAHYVFTKRGDTADVFIALALIATCW